MKMLSINHCFKYNPCHRTQSLSKTATIFSGSVVPDCRRSSSWRLLTVDIL